MNKIKLALVDDHTMFRRSLSMALREIPDFSLILEANNGQEFIDKLPALLPDVVLLDLQMPALDCPATVDYLRVHYPLLKVIVLITPGAEPMAKALLEKGACGYLSKGTALENVRRTIQAVFEGEVFKNELVWRIVRRKMTRQPPEVRPN